MKMLRSGFILYSAVIFIGLYGRAQNATFISQGKIEYERKDNLYDQFKDLDWDDGGTFSDIMKKGMPKFKLTYYDLSFSKTITLFKPGRENHDNDKMLDWFSQQPGESNIIYCNLQSQQSTSQKSVYGSPYLVQDSTRRIRWKITDETRTIAGFQCRRANAMIMDSVYVVAFYTDEIITSGGPESFSGLPGMILGLALPHQHITWFATKVEAVSVTNASLIPPSKGKHVTYAGLKEILTERMKEEKKWGRRILLYTLI
jgi:GLPGLI family protein